MSFDDDGEIDSKEENELVRTILILLAVWAFLTIAGCHDRNFIPYGIKALDVYVYNNETDNEIYAGRIKSNYFKVKKDLEEANSLAYSTASYNHLVDWSYICCTVTGSSDCATKVR